MQYLKSLICIVAACFLAPSAFSAGVAFPALQFLVGNWEAEAKPGEGAAHFEFSLDLQDKVLIRRNHAEYPASAAAPAGIHDDLLITYQEGTPAVTRAIYFDSMGYGARYTVTSSGAGQAMFVSDKVAKLPRYRLTYTQLPDGRLDAKLEVAPAGKPDAFANYLSWVSKKVNSEPPAPAAAKP